MFRQVAELSIHFCVYLYVCLVCLFHGQFVCQFMIVCMCICMTLSGCLSVCLFFCYWFDCLFVLMCVCVYECICLHFVLTFLSLCILNCRVCLSLQVAEEKSKDANINNCNAFAEIGSITTCSLQTLQQHLSSDKPK